MSLSAVALKLRGVLVPFGPDSDIPQCNLALEQQDTGTLFAILPRGAAIDLNDMVGSSVELVCTVQRPATEEEAALVHVRSYTELDEDI